eukprot:scaffold20532_cov123-Isochrysis_galbana.AAC.10
MGTKGEGKGKWAGPLWWWHLQRPTAKEQNWYISEGLCATASFCFCGCPELQTLGWESLGRLRAQQRSAAHRTSSGLPIGSQYHLDTTRPYAEATAAPGRSGGSYCGASSGANRSGGVIRKLLVRGGGQPK